MHYFAGSSDFPLECKFLVYFVDYGNTDQVRGSHVRLLPLKFCRLPCQALHITICENSLSRSSRSSPSVLIGSVVGVRTTAYQAPNAFDVKLLHPSKHNSSWECDTTLLNIPDCDQLSLPDIKFPFEAVVAHVNTVTDFYIHQLDRKNVLRMERLEADIQLYYSNKGNHNVTNVEAGVVGCAYSNGLYSRAIVLHTNMDLKCKVQLVDYGHTEEISVHDILELPLQLLHVPVCCVHCQLIFNNTLSIETFEECTSLFKEMATSVKVFTVVQRQFGKCIHVHVDVQGSYFDS